jgi:hypothetical protein
VKKSLKEKYIKYKIDSGILNWSIYNRKILKVGLSNIRIFENKGIKINHMEDFLNIIDIKWDEDDYYLYFKNIGKLIKNS